MRLRSKLLIAGVLASAALAPALADINYTQGAGTVIFAFTCFTTKVCPSQVLVDSTGTEKATSGNPLRTDPVGTTTQPVSAASLPLPSGASTSANQATNAATTAHTCSTAGFSELGCLGQIDDDIKGSIAAGANIIGKVGIDQTTPGTTNGVQVNAALPAGTNTIGNVGADPSSGKGTPSSAAISLVVLTTPVNSAFSTATTGGTLAAGTYFYRVTATNAAGETLASTETSQVTTGTTSTVTVNWGAVTGATGYNVYGRSTGAELKIATLGSVLTYTDTGSVTPSGALPAANTTAASAQIVGLSGTTSIYVTSFDFIMNGTSNVSFVYGTGTNCGTGQTSLTGLYPATAQVGVAKGSGVGTVLKVPSGQALCILSSAGNIAGGGSTSFQQF